MNPFDDGTKEQYLEGGCMFFAAALHLVYGWEIVYDDLLSNDDLGGFFQTGDHPFLHCWACPVEDWYVDVEGLHPPVFGNLFFCSYKELKYWMVWDVASVEPVFYQFLAEAVVLVREHYDYFCSFEQSIVDVL